MAYDHTFLCQKLLVFVSGHLACVKIVGRANFTSSIDFKTLVNELMEQKFTCFLLDLSDCVLMDSTFLGVFGRVRAEDDGFSGGGRAEKREFSIELLNPNPRAVAEVTGEPRRGASFQGGRGRPPGRCPAEVNGSRRFCGAVPGNASREEVTRNCLEAITAS